MFYVIFDQAPMTVYNYIGLLLKSLIVVTRSTPVYKLSRGQSSDTYRTCYEVYLRRPIASYDVDSFCRQPIGSVPSPLGAIAAFVIYRTKLTICPKQSSAPDLSSTIKDDHFNTTPPSKIHDGKLELENRGEDTVFGTSPGRNPLVTPISADVKSRQKRLAFGPTVPADTEEVPPLIDLAEMEPPFASLLRHAALGTSPPPEHVAVQDRGRRSPNVTGDSGSFRRSRESVGSSTESHGDLPGILRDDFVLVELKAPFAGQEDELGRFYRDCQLAPTLSMFEPTCSLSDMMTSITDQLVQFEASADEFNDFVTSLQHVE